MAWARRGTRWGLLLGGPGCTGPDLAELETQQQALEQEVAVLRQSVGEMRGQMQAMGMLPEGPAAQDRVTVTGALDLSDELALRVERTGEIPSLPPLGEPDRRDTTDCGYRFAVPWLEAISDGALEQSGSGRASPLQLLQDGRALTPHSGPAQYEKTCKFAFRHQPRYLFFSPQDSLDNIAGPWEVRLASEVPLPRSDDREMYWVYPGTSLVFSFEGWDAEAWGPLQIDLDARVLPVGRPEAPNARTVEEATATVLGLVQRSADLRLGFAHTPEPQAIPRAGPWTLEVSSPKDGPYVLLETLLVGNERHALVVTAAGALGSEAP